ncbi:MAG: bifunctional diguanylate cyclase/phosphodiesterase, partial [Pseudomonadota bacterium]|nr:bifunctional diguanylate cyclase/phosphodiesterase [Pseudomonadota bacterium]
VALLLMDLDRFKEVNDTLGHDYGDDLLQQVGVRLRQALLPSDTVARLGGDEFGILLPHLASHEAIDPVIRALHDSLDTPFMMDNIPIAVEASMGVALVPEHADSANVLMQRADIALYRAKGLASDYTIYSPRFSPQSPEWLGLMAELRDGLEQNQLRLYFQPKLDIRTGRITGCEALVRWQHPRHGLILPSRFILVAEQTGLIGPLTEWVVIEALKSCQELCHSQMQVKMSVNLSARSLHDTRLLQMIAQAIEAAGARPEQLMLEVTESAIVLDPQRAKENLLALSQMGVALSIDDFGTGYTSLASIKQLPVNEIKIDQSFVTNMLSDPKDAMIVRTVIDLGHNFGMTVVAEGVETRDVLNALGALDCDGVQGYFIGRPQPGPLLGQWLAESPWIAGSAGQAGY